MREPVRCAEPEDASSQLAVRISEWNCFVLAATPALWQAKRVLDAEDPPQLTLSLTEPVGMLLSWEPIIFNAQLLHVATQLKGHCTEN